MSTTDDEILTMYVEESREHLADIETDLLAIEERGADIDRELVNKVFRAAHSIKGGASFLNLVKVKELSHKIENVLDMLRKGELVPNPEIINILLVSFDKLLELINNVALSNEADISEFIVSLSGLTASYLPAEQKRSISNIVDIHLPNGKTIFQIAEFDLSQARKGGNFIYLVEYDLIHDVHLLGITPLDILKNMLDSGTILDCVLDILSVGTLDDEPSNKIPFYVLFGTLVDPDMISALFEVPLERIHLIPEDKSGQVSIKALEETSKMSTVTSRDAVKTEVVGSPVDSLKSAEESPSIHSVAAPTVAAANQSESTLRVNVNLLESLMNLAGELVLSRNQLSEAITLNDQRLIKACGQRISLVTSELQENIMGIRMQPIRNIFNKFPRVVRDLARDLGKDVRLNIFGEEVELDKTIIEGLSDPLTHLIRNAVDHGIELPEDRLKAGKSTTGTVNLKAYHEAGQVNIEITDDGAGIDPGKIASSALAKGLVSGVQLKTMSEKEILSLIFLPGFSTAQKVTEVSGRGVGMDVVKTNLDRLGGQVYIESEIGKGSIFKIKLPLTLAIIPCLIVSIGTERFAIPQVNVEELIRIPAGLVKERIERVGDAEVCLLRGKMIPLVRLDRAFDVASTFIDPLDSSIKPNRRTQIADRRSKNSPLFQEEQGITEEVYNAERPGEKESRKESERRIHAASDLNIVVVTTGTFQYGLVVDDLHDSVEIVVKPLGRHIKHLNEYAGATIMGNGRVSLIVDIDGLARVADLSSMSGTSRAKELAEDALREKYSDNQIFLLFSNSPDEQCAAHLDLVHRVDKVMASDIEHVAGKRVMKFRGASMPLFTLSEIAAMKPLPDKQELIVIVFQVAGREVGLLATTPLDTVEIKTAIDHETLRQKGIMGTFIINNRTTVIVDIFESVETLYPEWFEGKQLVSADEGMAPTILLAEDSDFFRDRVKRFLEEGGYKIIAAEDGLAAWNLLQEKADEVSLVVTDIEMPHLDGYGLTRNIRADERFSHLPVIAVTSLAGEDDIAKGKAAGVDDYQIKLDKEKLLEGIHTFLHSKTLENTKHA